MIKKDDILLATEYGKSVILYFYPQSSVGFSSRRNFRLRSDDKNPSCTVFLKDNIWWMQDKGGSDNKAYNAISLVMEREDLKFPQALEWIASKFAPHLLEGAAPSMRPEPTIKKVASSTEIVVNIRKDDAFTQKELDILGYKITKEICQEFFLHPVDSYITKDSGKGCSYEIFSTPEYPIYYYDYRTFGKLYQPLGEIRFMYVGEKPADFLFANQRTMLKIQQAKSGNINADDATTLDDEYIDKDDVDERMDDLIICSGPSDALNTYAAGYNTCWPNSESEELSSFTISLLFKSAKNVYVMYDIDDTGIRNMQKLALKYLDLKLLMLPLDLRKFKARGGKPCKDAKDFMMFYRLPGKSNPHAMFGDIVKTSLPLKFWITIETKKGWTYDLDNIPLYNFLAANGFYKVPSVSDKKGYKFVHLEKNIIETIQDEAMSSRCVQFLIDFLRTNTYYYSPALIRHITRSKQINLGSLDKLPSISPALEIPSRNEEHIFFDNCVARITPSGIDEMPANKCDLFTYEQKVIKHNFSVEKPFFEVRYSRKAQEMLNFLERGKKNYPETPELLQRQKEFDAMTDLEKWDVELLRDDCTFMKYIYNTGRLYCEKRGGRILTH